ncbi:Cytochrome P450 2C40 [Portunus trituberculatus]|uniref:Cytochrome P450 2C40 n=1 Tax=Portunus trituberculatus TaxID=210409 RepID=A0A5B7JZL5_PORTR|nr:Cytochrome P450 2C40 [Portunus trituberculatus]
MILPSFLLIFIVFWLVSGKRVCVGESLARMELFILTTMVFQCFTIAPAPGKSVNLTPDLSGFFLRKAMPNEFVFTVREQ